MKALRAGTPIDVEGFRLIPVERTWYTASLVGDGLTAAATKEPVAVVIRASETLRALDVEGHEVSVTELLRDVVDLREACGE